MKHWRITLCALLCFVLLAIFAQTTRVEAAATLTVYLDPAAGNDSADGLTEATAVKTYETAYGKVKAEGGTIVLLSDLEITTDVRLPKSPGTKMVTLTSKTGAEGISGTTDIRFNANTTLENLTVTLKKASSSYGIYGEGYKLVIGENVNCVGIDGYYFSLVGGKRWASASSTDLTVMSGTWRNIYAGTKGYKSGTTVAGVTKDVKLTVTGGTMTGFISPAYSNSAVIGGDVDIHLSNMTAATVYCSPAYTATVSGNVNVTLGEGTNITGSVFCGGDGSGSVTGAVNIILDGADTSGYRQIVVGGDDGYKGSVGSTGITLKKGIVGSGIKDFGTAALDVAQGDTLTIKDAVVVVDTAKCDGQLIFSGAATLNTKAVTGTLNCQIDGDVLINQKYVSAPAGASVVFPESTGVSEYDGSWEKRDLEQFRGLVLTAASGVTVNLYTGFDMTSTAQAKVEPYLVEGNTKYYSNISGKFHYVASGTGYYTYQKNVYISPEEALITTRINATPDKKTGTGWHTSKVYMQTDQVLKVLVSDKALWPEYADVFTTPAFGAGKAAHQHTTQTEMERFIQGLDDADDDMYVYSMGKSAQYNHDIPLVMFTTTDLSGAASLEEAAELVKANGKPTIHYRAHIHGDEYASGEGALAVIKILDGIYGQQVLEKVNVYVIPRLNPDGAQNNLRDFKDDLDGNRDALRMEGSEMTLHHKVFCLFEPEVMLDGHEAYLRQEHEAIAAYGAMIACGFSAQSNQSFRDMSTDMVQSIFDLLEEKGLDGIYYDSEVNGNNPNVARGYVGNQGTLFFLIETRGIRAGKDMYERRVISQVLSATAVIDYVANNAEAVQKVVDDERNRIIDGGMTYNADRVVQLETDSVEHKELAQECIKVDTATGEVTNVTYTPKIYETILRSRTAPTAYVIPAGESFTDAVLELMDKQHIAYSRLPEGAVVQLQQYTGSTTKAELTEEMEVTFPNGAYVFCMNQVRGTILSLLMEPDVTDAASYKGTIAQQGIITAADGVFPVYRYVQDLNSDGSITYDAPITTIRGDMNGDGDVTDADALYLLRHTLFSERYPISQSGDVNGDGDVTDADALYLLRFTLFSERYPLH